jgi:PDDEXK-like domain of unknown function (DUF3799)
LNPGIYPNVPRAVYENWDAVRYSTLRLFNKSAAHAREEMLHPMRPSRAMDFGSALHAAILEPDRFQAEYAVAPSQQLDNNGEWKALDRRTNIGKQVWKEFEEDNRGKAVITRAEYDAIKVMQAKAYQHPIAKQLMEGRGPTEVSLFWLDPEFGCACKARADKITDAIPFDGMYGGPSIVDIKTAETAWPRDFELAIKRYSYHQQAAYYLDGAYVLQPVERNYVLVVFETERPYEIAVYQVENAAISQGRAEYRKNLKLYQACRASGVWPGYPHDIRMIGLPSWAYRGTDEFASAAQ